MSNCPICDTEPLEAGQRNGSDRLLTCQKCAHIWQDPLEIRKAYNAQYVAERYDSYGEDVQRMSHLRLGFVQAFAEGKRLLDVGYGNGSFIHTAKKAGFAAYGYDVHGCGEKYGVKEVTLDQGLWDVVTLFDSLEHFDDLAPIKDLAARSIHIIVSTPARPTTFPHNLDWRHYRPGEHLHYFCPASLRALFRQHTLIRHGPVEDTIRGQLDGQPNILTYAFGPTSGLWQSLKASV